MAKRKRLSPTPQATSAEGLSPASGLMARPTAPVADIARDAATQAALDEISSEMAAARADGRLIQRIALSAVDEAHLVRDRIDLDPTEMEALKASLRSRGQQTPIEVTQIAPGRYGLVSGWRRLTALRALQAEGGEDPDAGHVLALVRAPAEATASYVAMVEENEIRAGLSFYERARIAARAAEQGVYPTAKIAVKGLFANVGAPKRSKINSFLRVYAVLDDALPFPAALSEKQGLALAKALDAGPEAAERLRSALTSTPPPSAEAQAQTLSAVLSSPQNASPAPAPAATLSEPSAAPEPPGVQVQFKRGHLELRGPGVTAELYRDMMRWLKNRG